MKTKILLLLILISIPCCIFSTLNYLELIGEEPRRAVVAVEMVITGEWVVPHIHGWTYYNKPPLFNWVVAGLFNAFDSFDEWIVRLPSLLSLFLIAIINFFIVRKFLSKEIAIFSSLFFVTAGEIFFYGTIRSGEIDLFYSLLVYLQIVLMFLFHFRKQYLWMFILSYFFAALGVLTKGLPSLSFQALTLLALVIYHKQIRLLISWKHFVGIAVFFTITGSYFYFYSQRGDVELYLINLCKEATMKSGFESKGSDLIASSLIYPLKLWLDLIPWSIFAVFLFSRRIRQKLRENPLLAFSVMFVLVNIPLYWFTSLPNIRYVYMFLPFLMIIFATAYDSAAAVWPKVNRIIGYIFTIFMIVVPVLIAIIPWSEPIAHVNHIFLKCALLFIVTVILLWRYLKEKELRIYYFILSLIFVRVASGTIALQIIKEGRTDSASEAHILKMLELTNNQPITLSAPPFEFTTGLAIGSFNLREEKIKIPRPVAYQIPYYYSKHTRKVMAFSPQMELGKFYLIEDAFIEGKNVTILYQFVECFWRKNLCLVRLNE